MERFRFEIRPVIERKLFENQVAVSFFTKWCEANDIELLIITREEWEKRENILEERPDGTLKLYLPKDLQLWEMVGVMERVGKYIFTRKSEKTKEAKEKLMALAKLFQNAGIYIAKRIGSIQEGREIAEALALEFYEYGKSLELGKRPETQVTINDLATENLTPEETKEVDRFLAGDELFESREQRVKKMIKEYQSKSEEELYEEERRKTLAQFFRVAQKAFELKERKLKKSEKELKPWESDTPIHNAFLERVKKALIEKIKTPKLELIMSVFQYGLERLLQEMKSKRIPKWILILNKILTKFGFSPIIEEKKLVDALGIEELRDQLEEIRKTGNIDQISNMERKIADIIQQAVSSFPYKPYADYPSEIIKNQYINCVGATILGGLMMREAGLTYLIALLEDHVVLLLITSKGSAEWRDMLDPPNEVFELTDGIIEGKKEDGTPITVKDIVGLAENPKPEGLSFKIKIRNRELRVTIFEPKYSQQVMVLNNLGGKFSKAGLFREAIETYKAALDFNPYNSLLYYNLGCVLSRLGRYKEAIKAFQRAIDLDSENPRYYNNLGYVLLKLNRYEEAIEACQKAIDLDPKNPRYYNNLGSVLLKLNRYEEAIEAYQKAIYFNPKNPIYYNNLGYAFLELNRYEEAIKAFQIAIYLDPKNPEYYHHLGLAFSKLRNYEEAVKVFYRAISLNPSNPIYYYHLGIALSNLNRYVEAIFMLKFFIMSADKAKYENLIKEAEEIIKKLESEWLKGKNY